MGGNVKIGEVQAIPFMVSPMNRSHIVKRVTEAIYAIDTAYSDTYQERMIGPFDAYAGSSCNLMKTDLITDEEFTLFKPIVGDIDVLIPSDCGAKLYDLLNSYETFAEWKVAGVKRHGIDITVILEDTLGSPRQFDFVKCKHTLEQSKFLHSSSWEDTKLGIKGLYHKVLLNAAGLDRWKFSISNGLSSRTTEESYQEPSEVVSHLFGNVSDPTKVHSFVGVIALIKESKTKYEWVSIREKFISDVDKINRADPFNAKFYLETNL